MGSIVMGGPPKPKTVVVPRQKYPEACVWQPTSNLLVLFKFFVEYTFIGIWVHNAVQRSITVDSTPVDHPPNFRFRILGVRNPGFLVWPKSGYNYLKKKN